MNDPQRRLYTAAETRALDRYAIERCGIAGYTLMRRAGEAAWRELARRWPDEGGITVVCGAGNNAGDGYVVARRARAAGRAVRVLALVPPGRLRGDAAQAWRDWRDAGGAVEPFDAGRLQGVVVDALLGTGLDRDVEGAWAEAIAAVNAAGRPVLALDIPSGLDADTGRVRGAAVRAAATVTFVGCKRGLFTAEGPDHAGEVRFARIGVPDEAYEAVGGGVVRLGPWTWPLPPRPRSAHKGSQGHVLVVGGERGMAGAALLAGEAAARVGAGLVTVATRPEHVAAMVAARPELMAAGVEDGAALAPLAARATVVAVGPGLGRGAWGRGLLEAALAAGLPTVVDADALRLLAGTDRSREDWILTPHPGEAAALLDTGADAVQWDRFAAAAAIRERHGGVCVLKGAGSVVAGAGGLALCPAGNPGMACGGMGDVLTGVLAGLLAQGLEAEAAAHAGVWLHARAGDLAAAAGGERGLLARDLMPWLRRLANP